MTSTPAPATTCARQLDLRDPLPTGTVVLEASAGTGKTYAIAALATRAVAEGRCTLPELLIVTFTRAATAELRERIRQRLTEAQRHLRAVLDGQPSDPGEDVVLANLADATTDEVAARHDRLVRAVTDFDAATISTIHGFTQQVLRSVGLAVDVPREITLLEDEDELLDEVVSDVYVRRYLGRADLPTRPKRSDVVTLAKLIAGHPDALLRPGPDVPDDDSAGVADAVDEHTAVAIERVACATELRSAIAARKRADGLMSYDDLLHALRAALRDPTRGAQARAVLRNRYRWALIDEFQDTDPVQWDILADAFRDATDPTRAMVLIGDPKQAIYSFRGADVRAYLAATKVADERRELATNFRSDPPLLDAIDRLLADTRFGEDDIRFRSVAAAERHRDRRVVDAADPASLQLRAHPTSKGVPQGAADVRRRIAHDLALELLDQLGRTEVGDPPRPVRPEDVAVLVRTNDEARLVQATLRQVSIPSVVNGVGSVLVTPATDDWRWLLDALERPGDPVRIRRLALSCWVGWRADALGPEHDDAFDALHDDVARWADVPAEHGVAALERLVLTERRVPQRLLAEVGGERHLTDVRHVGRLLHAAEREEDRGVSGLRTWLLAARAEAGDTATPSDEQARRLESDARAVQIVTVHRSKGLQYPVVCVPFSWSRGRGTTFPVVVHDEDVGGRVLDVGPKERPGAAEVAQLAAREQLGEQLRLLYVAVTRAQHRAIVWWAAPGGSERSALARVLFRAPDGRVALDDSPTMPADAATTLRQRFDGTATSITVLDDEDPFDDADSWEGEATDAAELVAASFERTLDNSWRRTSYSGLLRRAAQPTSADGAEHAHTRSGAHPDAAPPNDTVASEPEAVGKDDEPATDTAELDTSVYAAALAGTPPAAGVGGTPPAAGEEPLPLGGLRGGTVFGTLVHAVLEHVEFDDVDLTAALRAQIAEQRRWHRVPALDDHGARVLADGLVSSIHTPLGPLANGADGAPLRLADIPRTDRLDELDFELPLAGGDDANGTVTLGGLADLLDRPATDGGLQHDDPLRAARYADRLRRPGFRLDVRGYLNGSIDLVIRMRGADGVPRYLVADHKTNRLGGHQPTIDDYGPEGLTEAMVHGDYPLQALLYQVAVHRFLRWRQPRYDPDTHLGGVLYLFLRGMIGEQTPTVDGQPHGVYAWRPPTKLVTDLSDLLDGAGPAMQPTGEGIAPGGSSSKGTAPADAASEGMAPAGPPSETDDGDSRGASQETLW